MSFNLIKAVAIGLGCLMLLGLFMRPSAPPPPPRKLSFEDIFVINIPSVEAVHYPNETHLHPKFDRRASLLPIEDPEDYISQWKLKERAFDNNTIIITVANLAHADLTSNAAESIRRQGRLENFFAFCLDPEICEVLHGQGVYGAMVPDHWASLGLQDGLSNQDISGEAKFGTNTRYLSVTYIKQVVVWKLLHWGFGVIFTDADIVWVKPGLTDYLKLLLKKMPIVDFLGSVDKDDANLLQPFANSGFYFVRPPPIILKLFELVVSNQIHGEKVVSQRIFNQGLDVLGMKPNGRHEDKAYYLPPLLFCNGREYFKENATRMLDFIPYIVHPNYMLGKGRKADALKKAGLWFIEDAESSVPTVPKTEQK